MLIRSHELTPAVVQFTPCGGEFTPCCHEFAPAVVNSLCVVTNSLRIVANSHLEPGGEGVVEKDAEVVGVDPSSRPILCVHLSVHVGGCTAQ
eukprot:5718628-Pyramimonas_sp.AAC.1